jgi:putative phosphoribosyl transferase
MVRLPFPDREAAGRLLGRRLAEVLPGEPADPAGGRALVVLGLPRGGVIVAAAAATELGAPLDAFVVRKLPLPGRPELAMGAIAGGGVLVWTEDVLGQHRPRPQEVAAVVERERAELARREAAYRGDRPQPDLAGRTAVLVDDGVATGATARAALRAARALGPARVVLAAPVVPVRLDLRPEADMVVVLATPHPFGAVGGHYLDFRETTDDEVRRALGG